MVLAQGLSQFAVTMLVGAGGPTSKILPQLWGRGLSSSPDPPAGTAESPHSMAAGFP